MALIIVADICLPWLWWTFHVFVSTERTTLHLKVSLVYGTLTSVTSHLDGMLKGRFLVISKKMVQLPRKGPDYRFKPFGDKFDLELAIDLYLNFQTSNYSTTYCSKFQHMCLHLLDFLPCPPNVLYDCPLK